MDKKEDRLVRKGIHRLGKTADAESSDGSGDEVYEGRGKGRAVDVAIEIDREDAPAPMAQVTTDKGKKRSKLSKKVGRPSCLSGTCGLMKNQASWNPNLLSTQPDSDSSSDFDSSASENDQSDIVEAGPSSPRACPPPRKLPIASARPLPSPAIAIAGSARDSQEVNIKGPAPAVKNAFAGALKKSADRQVVQPRVIQRRQKMVRELVLFEAWDKCADTPFNSLLAGYERSQMTKATRRIRWRMRKTVTMRMMMRMERTTTVKVNRIRALRIAVRTETKTRIKKKSRNPRRNGR
jgi:hypothetical protein